LGIFVQLLLQRPIQLNPPDSGVRLLADIPQAKEFWLQAKEKLINYCNKPPTGVEMRIKYLIEAKSLTNIIQAIISKTVS